VTDLSGFVMPHKGRGASRWGKHWTARVGMSLDGNDLLTARRIKDVTSARREGGHVWNIALDRVVAGTEREEAAP
jgi:hypothetical protein